MSAVILGNLIVPPYISPDPFLSALLQKEVEYYSNYGYKVYILANTTLDDAGSNNLTRINVLNTLSRLSGFTVLNSIGKNPWGTILGMLYSRDLSAYSFKAVFLAGCNGNSISLNAKAIVGFTNSTTTMVAYYFFNSLLLNIFIKGKTITQSYVKACATMRQVRWGGDFFNPFLTGNGDFHLRYSVIETPEFSMNLVTLILLVGTLVVLNCKRKFVEYVK
jgi:hypothetical protein